ncbi:MAG: hypothetical protein COZ80_09810 [Ignavibacteria bacterium CG_4_8_14_3_um_filter_37_9]|nr:hypothetical protein [Ignavibacteria bacterium]OIO13734.1 MAG: hypothetical protein AUJ54_15615 [Ignavibacteria bacterium CG1_02_37_35]PIP76868.1 MAG: hypothetical protein COW85_11985 [Ignavibacteria bacterium CG22_combo_CG10-13_8_21_14_all_37_15]PIW98588.1 MAG: hypothetical protein COZ80_09810 [Ignavibacteria bacterium CG_4_8_14_3_um_filter_37_9]
MILVSISSTEEKFVIKLKHKIYFVVEKKFKQAKPLHKRTIYVFVQLFFSTVRMIYKELFMKPRA